jgi:tRNA dimethylallyltransferase
MDVGTAKPQGERRQRWHMVDVADPAEEYSVARFQREALGIVERAHGAGRSVVMAGGTGLYHRALVDGLALPGRYDAVRHRLESEAEAEVGLAALYERLCRLDPVAAGRIEPANRRRIIRALEVVEGSGRLFSEFGPGLKAYPKTETVIVGLSLDRERLDVLLEERFDAQLAAGFLDEVRRLAARPGGLSRTARQAIGYKEVLSYLAGERSLDEAAAEAVRRLRSFARRQESWFGRDPRVEWFDAAAPDLVASVAKHWQAGR